MAPRRLISERSQNRMELALAKAGLECLDRQVASMERTLRSYGIHGALTAAGRDRTGGAEGQAVTSNVWNQAEWQANVNSIVAQAAQDSADDAGAEAAGVMGAPASTWGMGDASQTIVQAITGRANSVGEALGTRVNDAALTADPLAAIRDTLLAAPDIVSSQIGLSANVISTMTSDEIAQHVTSLDAPAYLSATKTWNNVGDDRVREDHQDVDDVAINEYFDVGGEPMIGPGDPQASDENTVNCLIEGSDVSWAGNLRALYRRRYEGNVVELTTAEGHRLTITPNHPVLTERGWVAAQSLDQGDQVARAIVVQGRTTPDVDHVPPRVEQLFAAACQLWPTTRIGSSTVDFHGDGVDDEIEVVSADGDLEPDRKPSRDQMLGHRHLVGLQLAPGRLPPPSGAQESSVDLPDWLVERQAFDPTRGVGLPGVVSPFSGGESLHADAVGLAHTALLQTESSQTSADRVARAAEVFRHGQHARAVVVELTKLASVDLVPYSGHVYNFTCSQGWVVSDSIVHSNCRCWVTYDGMVPEGSDWDPSVEGAPDMYGEAFQPPEIESTGPGSPGGPVGGVLPQLPAEVSDLATAPAAIDAADVGALASRMAAGKDVTLDHEQIGPVMAQMKSQKGKASMSRLRVAGKGNENVFASIGVPRKDVPDVAKNMATVNGLRKYLAQNGVGITVGTDLPANLRSLTELDAKQVAARLASYEKAGGPKDITLILSRDGVALNGNIRLAAAQAWNVIHPDKAVSVKVFRTDVDGKTLLGHAKEFDGAKKAVEALAGPAEKSVAEKGVVVKAVTAPTPVAPKAASKAVASQRAAETQGAENAARAVAHVRDLAKSDLGAVKTYQGSTYRAINDALRRGQTPEGTGMSDRVRTAVRGLDRAIASWAPLPKDKIVGRGLNFSKADRNSFLSKIKPGETFTDKAFVSTTKDVTWKTGQADYGNNVAMRITLPKGTRAVDLEPLGYLGPAEKELLLARGATFRVDQVELNRAGKVPLIHLTYMGSPQAPIAGERDVAEARAAQQEAERQEAQKLVGAFGGGQDAMVDVFDAQTPQLADEAFDKANQLQDKVLKEDSPAVASAWKAYGSYSNRMTDYLTDAKAFGEKVGNGPLQAMADRFTQMEQAFNQHASTMAADRQVWAGLAQAKDWRPGQVVSEPGYLSTALSRQTAEKYATTIVQIDAPAGTRYLVGQNANIPGLILPRNTVMEVQSKVGNVVHVKLIPEAKP